MGLFDSVGGHLSTAADVPKSLLAAPVTLLTEGPKAAIGGIKDSIVHSLWSVLVKAPAQLGLNALKGTGKAIAGLPLPVISAK